MTSTRTDIHRPSAPEFDPEAYDCVGVYDLYPEIPNFDGRVQTVSRLVDQGYHFAPHATSGQCGHCGTRIRYAALMLHPETHVMFYVGETCLDNRFDSLTKAEFHALREAAKLNRERLTADEKAAAHLAAAIEIDPRAARLANVEDHFPDFVADIASKMAKYELSERQVKAACDAMDKADARKAQRAAEQATATPVPVSDKRMVITGEVLSTRWEESPFYGQAGTTKMLVRDDRGFKVWGTRPSSLDDTSEYNEETRETRYIDGASKGDRVTFTAKVEASNDDKTFGFFSRPTKGSIVSKAPVTE